MDTVGVPSTTDVIQVVTGIASLAVSALALREARLQRAGRGESGMPPPAPAPHLPMETAALPPPLAPSPSPVAPPRADQEPSAGSPPAEPPAVPGPAPAAPPEPPWALPQRPRPWTGGEPPGAPSGMGRPSDPGATHGWVAPSGAPVPYRGRRAAWVRWAAVVGVSAALLGVGYAALFRGDAAAEASAPGGAGSSFALASVGLLVLTVVIALVVRGRRAPSRAVWAAVPAVLAAASVGLTAHALPVPGAVKLGAALAALGIAAWATFRR
ncbi:hypothetical protein [Phytohabitans houttuyneae]|uniref:Uncharacterized protein n=1 Tax=Phytohabitans houttuyneae TaxID=1076126 RepID=A0A6V8KQT3_9ACTN|nr:hypothetical protein [Phytohabitans houttuyneae]GFJ84137.1 hypothetical protein Phou_083170 [Phytohabitans houttuyneae]